MRPQSKRTLLMVLMGLLSGGAVVLLAMGCASIIHGTLQDIGVASTPAGASVTIDGNSVGNTPITTKLSRKQEHKVRIEMQGYQPVEMALNKRIDGWFWGNLLLGGLIGMVIDGVTGSMYQLSPKQIEATLKQEGTGLRLEKDMLLIAVTLHADPTWRKIGQMERLEKP